MSSSKRAKLTGRREGGQFIAIPLQVLSSQAYSALSSWGVKLLIDLYSQYNGCNNGDFCAAWSVMRERGWRSKGTLYRAINELIKVGFIVKSRQGGKHMASLYAVTFREIDDCGNKLDIRSTRTAADTWKEFKFAAP